MKGWQNFKKERLRSFGWWVFIILIGLTGSLLGTLLFWGYFFYLLKFKMDLNFLDAVTLSIKFYKYFWMGLKLSSLKLDGMPLVYFAYGYSALGILLFILFITFIKKAMSNRTNSDTGHADLYGSAHFATRAELIRSKMLVRHNKKRSFDKELIVGRRGLGDFYAFGGPQFIALAAPTRTGKGVGFVIPNCLNYPHNLWVYDPKGENRRISGAVREKIMGHKIITFAPFEKKTHRYNPFYYVDFGADVIIDSEEVSVLAEVAREGDFDTQVANLSKLMFPENPHEKDPFFSNQARNLFIILMNVYRDLRWTKRGLYFCYEFNLDIPDEPTCFFVGTMVSGFFIPGQSENLITFMDFASKREVLSPNTLAMWQVFRTMGGAPETFSSVQGVFTSAFGVFNNARLRKFTETNDIDFRKLREDKMDVFFIVSPDDLPSAGFITRLIHSDLITKNLRELPQNNPKLKRVCTMLMDEFVAAGYLEIFVKGVGYMAGYNMRMVMIYQNDAQLESAPPLGYGREAASTLKANHACNLYYGINHKDFYNDAKKLSDTLGTYTTTDESQSIGHDGKISRTISKKSRALMLPQEIMTLNDDLIILTNETSPIRAHKAFYYDDPYFTDKFLEVSPYLKARYKKGQVPSQQDFETAMQMGELDCDHSLIPTNA